MGSLIVPTLICATWMCVWGGNALYMQHTGIFDFKPMLDASVASPIFGLLQNLPGTTFLSILVMLVIAIFFITSADSQHLPSVCTVLMVMKTREPGCVLLGCFEGGLALILLLTGGLAALQTASIVGALPFMIFMVMMIFSIVRTFNKHIAKDEQRQRAALIEEARAKAAVGETPST